MMRGGASVLAARLFFWLAIPVVSPAQTRLVRTRDAGFATVRYENGLTLGAMTLYEGLEAQRKNSLTALNGLLSLFHDGRWSMQGLLQGSKVSDPITTAPGLTTFAKSVRGEVALAAGSSAQSGFMPTLQLSAESRVHFDHDSRGSLLGAGVARTFDGRFWGTTVLGEANAWWRHASTLFSLRTTPMQLSVGDFLQDIEGELQWEAAATTFGLSLGIRLGEAQRGTVGWGAFVLTWPLRPDLYASISAGSYPADLLQSLPGGRYAAMSLRLPNGRIPPLRRRPPPPPERPRPPELPLDQRLTLVIGFALDSADLREVRVWAPGAEKVELLGDFVDWLAVPLIKQPNGEWRGYYRVSPGLHRVNVRLDGEVDVPLNLAREEDEFLGVVGLILVSQ